MAPPARDRWRVDRVCLRSRDSFFESDCQYEFRVIDTLSGKTALTFWRDEYANDAGTRNTGARSVTLDAGGTSVVVEFEDAHVERHALPR